MKLEIALVLLAAGVVLLGVMELADLFIFLKF